MDKILIVDDDLNYLDVISDLLKREGFAVEVCADPAQAIALLEKSGFRCVLLDYRMPRMDGQDILRIVHTKYPKLPVIICSGYTEVREFPFAHEGAFEILHKPFDRQVLFDTIHRALTKDEEMTPIYVESYDLRKAREMVFRKLIIKALTKTEFNVTQAALLLGISRQYLIRYIKRYQINY